MIDYTAALDIAKKYYAEKGVESITKAYDAEDLWIIYGGKLNQPKIGNAGIAISKTTGEIRRFVLPSRENFAILRAAKEIELEPTISCNE